MRPARPPPLTPRTLARAPALGVLTLLDEALHLARLVLVAEHPTLDTGDHGRDRDDRAPPVRLAYRIIDRAQPLHRLLDRYRAAVTHALEPPPTPSEIDIDF